MAKKILKKSLSPSGSGKSRTARVQAEKPTESNVRQKDPHGFIEGTDSSIAAYALVEGGTDRLAIYERIRNEIESNTTAGLVTRKGTEKNIPNLAATVVKQMRNRGWIVESTWRMVKDPNFIEPTEEADQAAVADAQSVDEPETSPEPVKAPKKRRKVNRGSRLG